MDFTTDLLLNKTTASLAFIYVFQPHNPVLSAPGGLQRLYIHNKIVKNGAKT